jgi:ABC-type transport system involved in multi-copper enzyme maturation permease subunit
MTFLPIVARELGVAARKRATFWLRVGAAVAGLVVGGACLMMTSVNGMGSATFGSFMFGALAWMSAATALCAGLFLTSDSLSEEKREGTMGLLFLTDLRGYDVASGKFLACSLRGFYALLAVFPILAVTLLMGGVTGTEFWKTCLALLNALLCSLSAGLFVSALSRDSQKALAGTFGLMLLLTLGGPIADSIRAGILKRPFSPVPSLVSPAYVLSAAGQWGRSPFWLALCLNQAIVWLLFALACVLVPRSWQEKTSGARAEMKSWSYDWKYGGKGRREWLRRRLLDLDPVLWLVCRERWQSLALWITAAALGAGFAWTVLDLKRELWMVWGSLGALVMFAFHLWVASQSGRFFIEVRRNGFMELLLVAPLNSSRIIRGHWRAFLRMFGCQLLLVMCVQAGGAMLQQAGTRETMNQAQATMAASMAAATNTNSVAISGTSTVTTVTVVTTKPSRGVAARYSASPVFASLNSFELLDLFLGVIVAVTCAANFLALVWFGMWMGMTSRTASLATLKTIAFVQVIPALVFTFVSWMVTFAMLIPWLNRAGSGNMQIFALYPLITASITAVLAITKDAAFIAWSRRRIYSSFREQATMAPGQTARRSSPPPIPAPPLVSSAS